MIQRQQKREITTKRLNPNMSLLLTLRLSCFNFYSNYYTSLASRRVFLQVPGGTSDRPTRSMGIKVKTTEQIATEKLAIKPSQKKGGSSSYSDGFRLKNKAQTVSYSTRVKQRSARRSTRGVSGDITNNKLQIWLLVTSYTLTRRQQRHKQQRQQPLCFLDSQKERWNLRLIE